MSTAVMEFEIGADSSMAKVLERYPGARRALFRKYHIGGCSSCGFEMNETLAELCVRNGNLNLGEVVEHIQTSHAEDEKMQVSARELDALRKEGQPMRLLDIRSREEFEAARIDGATLFTQDVMNEMLARWPRQDLVVIYDHSGAKSMDAAAYFLGHGFQNVRSLRGGIDAWSSEVDSTVPRYRLE